MKYTRLVASGGYLPEKTLTNEDLANRMDTSNEWIKSRTGIVERHIVAADESSTDMAYRAARRALEASPYTAEDLDLILVATSTPEHIFPSNASQLQRRLGCRTIAAMDIEAACSGFIYAMTTADAYIKSGMARCVLIVGSELMSANLDWEDRKTAVLFGDGAGAVIVTAAETPGIHGCVLHSDGGQGNLLRAPGGPGIARDQNGKISRMVQMQGREVFKIAVRSLSSLVGELLETCRMSREDIDFLVPHQANLRIIRATADHLDLPMEKVIVTVDRHANTSAASVPLALDHGIRCGRIQRGQTLLLEAFGSGFTWGGCILTY